MGNDRRKRESRKLPIDSAALRKIAIETGYGLNNLQRDLHLDKSYFYRCLREERMNPEDINAAAKLLKVRVDSFCPAMNAYIQVLVEGIVKQVNDEFDQQEENAWNWIFAQAFAIEPGITSIKDFDQEALKKFKIHLLIEISDFADSQREKNKGGNNDGND